MADRKQHPSGRPVREGRVIGRSIWRVPDDGPVTPRLRERHGAQAIGFTASLYKEADSPEDRMKRITAAMSGCRTLTGY